MRFKTVSFALILISIGAYFIFQPSINDLPEKNDKKRVIQNARSINNKTHTANKRKATFLAGNSTPQQNASPSEQPGIDSEFTGLIDRQIQEAIRLFEDYPPIFEENLSDQELLEEMDRAIADFYQSGEGEQFNHSEIFDTAETSEYSDTIITPAMQEEINNTLEQSETSASAVGDAESIDANIIEMENAHWLADHSMDLVPENKSVENILSEMESATRYDDTSQTVPGENIEFAGDDLY